MNKLKVLILLFFLLICGLSKIGASGAYYSDYIAVGNNVFSIENQITLVPRVVINEIMWMGSIASEHLDNDEWIELKNTTGSAINLNGWKIDGAGSGSDSITLSGTISANGYFLINHYSSDYSAINNLIIVDQVIPGLSLVNSGEQLTLRDTSNIAIDQTPSGTWVAGVKGVNNQTMERNDNPLTGWHTCIDDACNDATYWDIEANNYGTPKAANLSFGDMTSEIKLDLYTQDANHKVGFKVYGDQLIKYDSLTYTLIYDSNQGLQAIKGDIAINGKNTIGVDKLILGSCSSNDECVFSEGVTNIKIEVTLTGVTTQKLIKEIKV